MRVTRSFLIVALYLGFSVLVFSQTASLPEVIYGGTCVEWPAAAPDGSLLLTVSGPAGLYLRQEQPAGSWGRFSLADAQGQPRPDGVYKWEVVVQAGWENASQATESGWFVFREGRVATEGRGESQPVVVEEQAPQNSLYVDSQGRVGVGTSVPGAQLHLKGTAPALAFEDTHAPGSEYRLRSLGKGDGSLGLFDETSGEARWLVDSEGRMGVGTAHPTSTLTVDGYIETTKGFLVNGRPVGTIGFGLSGGAQPLYTESTGNNFFGTGAGLVSTGTNNSFFGADAGRLNTTGFYNSMFGHSAGYANTTGSLNSFFGRHAGYMNKAGSDNSFFGDSAGAANTTGWSNAFFGRDAGYSNTIEGMNTFIGAQANLSPGVRGATAIGYKSYVSRSYSLVLGAVNGFNGAQDETFVGIGTPSPDRQLVVEGSQALGKFRRYNATAADFGPAFLFERARGTNTVPADILPGDYLGKVQFRGRVGGTMPEYGALVFIASDMNQNGRFAFVDRDLVTERMVILNTGNVGIGTSSPTERLDVAGNLRIRGSVVYGAPAAIPDYVFEPDYRLMSLTDLEQYVRSEKHLPSIPKASEINDNGVNLGEFQMKLLEKIEELTLYVVEQAKANNRLREEAAAQKEESAAEVRVLRERVKTLEEMAKTLGERDKVGR